MNTINKKSGYWLGSDMNDRYYDPLTGKYNKPKGKDVFAMAGYQRAISNFVNIICQQSVPVTFNTGDDSYTDGKTVVLSGNINDGNFDVAVGLALHEGSHIKLTDFSLLKKDTLITESLKQLGDAKGYSEGQVEFHVKNLLNVVEDRRIDYYVQTTAPGYRGYYEALYDKYFNARIIDKALREGEWSEPTLDNYFNHIINFINPNRTLDVLPGLRDIWNTFDLRNIKRLKTTEDALRVAQALLKQIYNQLPDATDEDDNESKSSDEQLTLEQKIRQRIKTLTDINKRGIGTAEQQTTIGELLRKYEAMLAN